MERRDPPTTAEGWYALHDVRSIDWDGWADRPDRERERLLADARAYLEETLAPEAGQSAVYTILGADADLLLVHLRPRTADLDAIDRATERSALGRITDRVDSFVSVTEASGYSDRFEAAIEGEGGEGIQGYVDSRLYPEIPETEHVVFYPMSKRRRPEQNWYDLPFEERAEHMAAHGEIGRQYAGRVTQMITGAVGLDDHEWGVTLWADDLTDVKALLYEMRFDPSTSQFAAFGSFLVGRTIGPADLPSVFAGDPIDAPAERASAVEAGSGSDAGDERPESGGHGGDGRHGSHGADAHPGEHGGASPHESHGADDGDAADDAEDAADAGHPSGGRPSTVEEPLEALEPSDAMAGLLGRFGVEDPAGAGYALALTADADAAALEEAVAGLRENFEHYDSHAGTYVRASGGTTRVISLWDSERAATTAAGFLLDLDGVTGGHHGPLEGATAGDTEGSADRSGARAAGERDATAATDDALRADVDVFAGQPRDDDLTALVAFSSADPDALVAALEEAALADRAGHHETTVYRARDGEETAVVALFETLDDPAAVAETLDGLPGVEERAAAGYATLGMFYRVKPDYREEFVETFETVADHLAGIEGHRETRLFVDHADETNTFIDSRWVDRASALEFFRSEQFRETVEWGREVLADRPRHVVLADPSG